MKAIMISIKPQHVANILNGIKTIEVRKKFPKDYVGWVYIYCTKARQYLVKGNGLVDKLAKEHDKNYIPKPKKFELYNFEDDGYSAEFYDFFNGKVVARFWCDKVEYIENYYDEWRDGEEDYRTETLNPNKLYEKSCLPFEEMDKYLQGDYGYAIHITNLKLFDKPKEISEFYTTRLDQELTKRFDNSIQLENGTWVKPLTRAPQSFCFIEIGE